ncbi:MAG: DUF3108 domain-containing protein [Elusimicrobia bacterium]|nr:DUF3108 domain-containing protein [Elusimicrobiota bacterium]
MRLLLWLGAPALLLSGFPLFALEPGTTGQANAPSPESSALAETARAIGLGREEYIYSVHWGVIKVGRSTLGSPAVVERSSRTAYHLLSSARTLPFFDTFYKVRDRNEAWLDVATFQSLGFGKYLREGRFRRHEIVDFDHEAGRFTALVKKKDGTEITEQGSIKPGAYDVMSALYWIRTQDLVPGKEFSVDVNTRKDWPLKVRVLKREKVRTPAGEFDCLVVEPMLRDEGIFIQKGKSMRIWFTNDARKIPVQVKAEVFIGSVRAELEEIVYADPSRTAVGLRSDFTDTPE